MRTGVPCDAPMSVGDPRDRGERVSTSPKPVRAHGLPEGKQLSEVQRAYARQVSKLRPAGEPVGQDDGARPRGANRGQQRVLGDRHRDVVVALLEPEVAGQQLRIGFPAQHTTAWWQCGCAAARLPARSGGRYPSVSASCSASVRTEAATSEASGSSGSRWRASLRSTAVHEGSSPTSGVPVLAGSASAATVRRSWTRAASSCPVEMSVSPQHSRAGGTSTR